MNEAFNEAASAILFDAKRAGSGPALVQRLRPTATPRSSDSGGVHISKRQWNWALGAETEREKRERERTENETEAARNLTSLAGIILIPWNRIYITTMSANLTDRKIFCKH